MSKISKKRMIEYITSFDTYYTMNSWNRSEGYSFNVKIHNLPLTRDQKDVLYEALDCIGFYDDINDIIFDWRYEMKKYGTHFERVGDKTDRADFDAGFNGRSGGYLVLYRWNGYNYFGTGWKHDRDDLEEMSMDNVEYIYNVLRDFEGLYNSLLDHCKYIADNYRVDEEEYTEIKKRPVLVER